MRDRIRRTVPLISLLAATVPALANDAQWMNPSGGTWSTAPFWSTGAVPTSETNVSFNLHSASSYSVFIPASPPAAAASLTVQTDKLALYLNTRTLPLAGPLVLAPASGDSAQLTLTFGGTLSSSATAASTVATAGGTATLNLAGSALSLAGPLQVGAGGTATVNVGEASSLTASDIELATAPLSTASLDATYVPTPTRQQTPPRLTTTGSFYVGGTSAGPGGVATFSTNGTVTIPGTLTVYDTGSASPAGTRVNLTGGTLSVGSLDTSGNPARFNWTAGTLRITNSSLDLSPTGPLGSSLTLGPVSNGSLTLTKNLFVSGTLSLAPGSSLTSNGATVNAGAIVNAGTLTGTGVRSKSITNTGTLDLSLGAFPGLQFGSLLINSGGGTMNIRDRISNFNASLVADGGQVFLSTFQYFEAVTLSGSATLTLLNGPDPTSRDLATHALSIVGDAKLDLGTQSLFLPYATPQTNTTPAPTVRQWLHDGSLMSTVEDPDHRYSVGYQDTGLRDPSLGSWVTARRVLTGDANMNGKIDPDDYALLDRAYATSLSDAYWTDGDFDYDGVITSADYLLIDGTFGGMQGLSPEFLSLRESEFGPAYVADLLASVPEPSALAAGLPALLLFRKRRGYPTL